MPHKTITISEEAYDMLTSLKTEGESFTEVIKRTAKKLKERPLSSFAGKWTGNSQELDTIIVGIKRTWDRYDQELGMKE